MIPLLLATLSLLISTVAQSSCSNYGSSSSSACLCPPGFTNASTDCTTPVCGGSLGQAGLPGITIPRTSRGFGNTSSSVCACSNGWSGPGCTVCSSANACRDSFAYLSPTSSVGDMSALNTSWTCNAEPTTYTSSQLSCNVNSPTLKSLFPLESVLTITRTVDQEKVAWINGSAGGLGMDLGGSGSAFAQLWYEGEEQVSKCLLYGSTELEVLWPSSTAKRHPATRQSPRRLHQPTMPRRTHAPPWHAPVSPTPSSARVSSTSQARSTASRVNS